MSIKPHSILGCPWRGDKDGKVGAVQFTPTAAGAFFGIDGLRTVVHPQNQRARGAEFNTESAAFAPVVKNMNLAPGPTPLPGTRFYSGSHGSRNLKGCHCSSSNIELGEFLLTLMMINENRGLVKEEATGAESICLQTELDSATGRRRTMFLVGQLIRCRATWWFRSGNQRWKAMFLLEWVARWAARLLVVRCWGLFRVGRQRGTAIPDRTGRASCERRGPGDVHSRKSSGRPRGR